MPQDWPNQRRESEPRADVTRADIDRIHDRFDKLAEGQSATAIAVARIEVQIATIKPPPALPARPCPDFVQHVADHKEEAKERRRTWTSLALEIAKPALGAVGGALAVLWGAPK